MATRRIVIDTDGGVDDAAALWWALSHPDVDVVAVLTTAGNIAVDAATANVQRILTAAGRPDVPIAVGAPEPIGASPISGRAAFVHGEDGLGGHARRWSRGAVEPVEEPAAGFLVRLTTERPGDLDLVCIGPLSTLAGAVAADVGVAGRLRSLTVMGGAVARPGNALPVGEANIAHDPDAAAAVVAAPWANPPILVPLDVSQVALLHDDDLDLAGEGRTDAARFLNGPLASYADLYRRAGSTPSGTFPCHDLLALLVAVEPSMVTEAPVLPLGVDTGRSVAWGATIADLRPSPQTTPGGLHPWRVSLGVDVERFRTSFRSLCGD